MKEATQMKIGVTNQKKVSITLSRKGFMNNDRTLCYYDLTPEEVDEMIGLLKIAKFKVQ